jgi:hypothetical protein
MRRFAVLLLFLACSFTAIRAWGGEWTSPKGFALTFPDGWKALTDDELNKVLAAQKPPADNAPKPPPPEIILVGPAQGNFTAQLNVTLIPQAIAFNAMIEGQLLGQFKAAVFTAGTKIGEIKTGHLDVDKRRAFSMAYEQEAPDDPVRCWKVYVPGAKQTYLVTCAAKKAQWETVFPDFKKIISGIRVDVKP